MWLTACNSGRRCYACPPGGDALILLHKFVLGDYDLLADSCVVLNIDVDLSDSKTTVVANRTGTVVALQTETELHCVITPQQLPQGGSLQCQAHPIDTNARSNGVHPVRVRFAPHANSDDFLIVLWSDDTIRVYELRASCAYARLTYSLLDEGGNISARRHFGWHDPFVDFDVCQPSSRNSGNGDTKLLVLAVSAAGVVKTLQLDLTTFRQYTVSGPLRIEPDSADNYGDDVCSALVLRPEPEAENETENNCIFVYATASGTVYNCQVLCESFGQGRSEYSLRVLEIVEVCSEAGDVLLYPDPIWSGRYFAHSLSGVHCFDVLTNPGPSVRVQPVDLSSICSHDATGPGTISIAPTMCGYKTHLLVVNDAVAKSARQCATSGGERCNIPLVQPPLPQISWEDEPETDGQKTDQMAQNAASVPRWDDSWLHRLKAVVPPAAAAPSMDSLLMRAAGVAAVSDMIQGKCTVLAGQAMELTRQLRECDRLLRGVGDRQKTAHHRAADMLRRHEELMQRVDRLYTTMSTDGAANSSIVSHAEQRGADELSQLRTKANRLSDRVHAMGRRLGNTQGTEVKLGHARFLPVRSSKLRQLELIAAGAHSQNTTI